jgi:HSF-type DNA-binding
MMTFNPKILSWVNDSAFEISDPAQLESEVLPVFFRHCRFQSFVRQLNFYAFRKISKERNSWVYSHEFFRRDRPDMLDMLRRKTNGLHTTQVMHTRRAVDTTADECSFEGKPHHLDSDVFFDTPGVGADNSVMSTSDESSDDKTVDADQEEEEDEDMVPMHDLQYTFDYSYATHLKFDFLPLSLQSYCMQRNPWQNSSTLVDEIRLLLAMHADLETEFYDYVRVLEVPRYVNSVQFNEELLVRYFVIFAVSRLQMAKYSMEEHDEVLPTAFVLSVEAWLTFAKTCL